MHTGNLLLDNRKKEQKYQSQFYRVFKIQLHTFFSYITGFDIIAFDEYLNVPDGVSTKDFIEARYGNDAVKLIETLIVS